MESKILKLAIFDFDGTITKKDTLIDFTLYYYGLILFFIKFILIFPQFLLYLLKIINNENFKNIYLKNYFHDVNFDLFNFWCEKYANERLPKLVRSNALERIKYYYNNNIPVIIVSASPEYWIKFWAKENNIYKVIGTKLEVRNNKLTGLIDGFNCYGEEKLKRLKKELPDLNNYYISFYGDSKGDLYLLEIADEKFFKYF